MGANDLRGCMLTGCQKFGFLDQRSFRQTLIYERKRSERSKRPLVLLLMDLHDKNIKSFFYKRKIIYLMRSVYNNVRETDIIGWYEYNRTIGVIFTETQILSSEIIKERLKNSIRKKGSGTQTRVLTFPSNDNDKNDENSELFYPEEDQDGKKKIDLVITRILDVSISLLVILLLLPVFLIISLIIKIDSSGPVLFKQKRIGIKGKVFTLYKFRTMYINNNDSIHRKYVSSLIKGEVNSGAGVYKITDDPRVTKIGRFLRKSSFDEFPQFLNVFWGDMAIVGPRPAIPYETDVYQSWHWRRIMECKPGITGLWQVYGRSKTTFDGMVRMDIKYLKRKSIFKNMILILKTPAALLFARGAY